MGLLDRIVNVARQAGTAVPYDSGKATSIAGCHEHTAALERVVRKNEEVRARVHFRATLAPAAGGKVDVVAHGSTIGHLPREDHAAHHEALTELSGTGKYATVPGTIYAGHHGGKHWSVEVKVPPPSKLKP